MSLVVKTPMVLAAHVHGVAAAFGVTLVEDPALAPEQAGAIPRPGMVPAGVGPEGVVVARPVTDETSYAVVLHELGHVIAPSGQLGLELECRRRGGTPTTARDWALLVVEEEAAWEWAKHDALDWTPAMESVCQYALSTYRAGARKAAAARSEAERRAAEGRAAACREREALAGFTVSEGHGMDEAVRRLQDARTRGPR
ncbi:MAG: hypothetical protein IMZ67_07240 [Acidobacteria bacterium]|nr:hypothetical protein [Acidobacteriota bacterium]